MKGESHHESPNLPDFSLLENSFNVSIIPEEKVSGAYRLKFPFENGINVHIRILLNDETGSDIVITNMTTLQAIEKTDVTNKGYGTAAINALLEWAASNNLNEIRATQIRPGNECFWIKNGFVRAPEPNPTNDYVRSLI